MDAAGGDTRTTADAAADTDRDVAPDVNDAVSPDDVSMPVGDPLPAFDAETIAHVRDLVMRGAARGNRHDVFAKIGDSISESRAYLYECGDGSFYPGPHTDLMPTVQYFSMRTLDADGFNSFTRGGLSATSGWSVADALDGGEASPLAQELDAIQPQWALIMYGTNDLERVDVATYSMQMASALDLAEERGVVPVLSTIPPRLDDPTFAARVPTFNDAIRSLARARHTPWMDYWAVLDLLPDKGLGPDGEHPDVYMEGQSRTCDVGPDGVRYGYNVRNLLAIEMLARLQAY